MKIELTRGLQWGLLMLFDENTSEDIPEEGIREGEVQFFRHTFKIGARHWDDGNVNIEILFKSLSKNTSGAAGRIELPSGSLAIFTSRSELDRKIVQAGLYDVFATVNGEDCDKVTIVMSLVR